VKALATALGALAVPGPAGLTLIPASTRQVTEALQILASQNASLNKNVTLSLAELKHVSKIEPKGGTVEVGGGMTLAALDAMLATHQLMLGPLSPRAKALTVAEFLEGPDAGLRAIPGGGRLEPICLAITAVLPDGRVYRSHPSPRSAAGPDLVALMLGGQRRFGVITEATLRCFPFAASHRNQVFSFPSADAFVTALMACLADGVWFEKVRVETRSDRAQVELNCLGTEDGVERDFASIGRRAFDVGGRPTGRLSGEFPMVDSVGKSWAEQEATWDAVRAAVAAFQPLELHRLSLASVIARGEIAGMPLSTSGTWGATSAALAAAMDPRGVLGGAP
jgi:FAD/FMN-containing dehydrogenase